MSIKNNDNWIDDKLSPKNYWLIKMTPIGGISSYGAKSAYILIRNQFISDLLPCSKVAMRCWHHISHAAKVNQIAGKISALQQR